MITSADLTNRAALPPATRGFRGRITVDEATQEVTETPADEREEESPRATEPRRPFRRVVQ